MRTSCIIYLLLFSTYSVQSYNLNSAVTTELCQENLRVTKPKSSKEVSQYIQCKVRRKGKAGATKQVEKFYISQDRNAALKVEPVELGAKLAYSSPWMAYISGLFAKKFTEREARKKFNTDPNVVHKQINHYLKLYKDEINMDEFETPQQGFQTFNDWFIRKLKNVEVSRPMDSSPDIIVSPVDCKVLVIPDIRYDTMVTIKEKDFNVVTLLGGDELLAQSYKDGMMMVFRLAPYDYHRYYYPIDCFVGPQTHIEGNYHSVNPRAFVQGVKPLTVNKRSYELLKPGGLMEAFHDKSVVMVHVGATAVASIVNYFSSELPYSVLHAKGTEMGYFAFGGSTLVMLFKKGVVIPNKQIVQNSLRGYETAVKVRENIARWKKKRV